MKRLIHSIIRFQWQPITPWVRKGCHPNHGYNFVTSRSIRKIRSLLQRAVTFQQSQY